MELIIGSAISGREHAKYFQDIYEGLSYLEKKRPELVLINLENIELTPEQNQRIKSLILSKQIPTLLLCSDKNQFQEDFQAPFFKIIPCENAEELLNESIAVLEKQYSLHKKIIELSKQKRTLPFYLLGTLLFCEPLIKILYLKFSTGFDFGIVFNIVFSLHDPVKLFEFWGLFPLAGLALVRASAWSLFTFAGVYLYSAYSVVIYEKFTWPYLTENPHLSANFLLFFNSALFIYFLIPENRKPFVQKAQNLFRNAIRVEADDIVHINFQNKQEMGKVLNFSKTGALVSSKKALVLNQHIELSFQDEQEIEERVLAYIVRDISSEDEHQYGVEFRPKDRRQKNSLKKLIGKYRA